MNLILIPLLLIPALPQSPEADGNFPQLEPAMDAWQVNHGEEWQVRWDRNTGYAEILFGFNAAAPFEPTEDNDWFGLTRVWAAEAIGRYGPAYEAFMVELKESDDLQVRGAALRYESKKL